MVMLKFRESTATDKSRSYGPNQSPEIDATHCKACGSESLFDGFFDGEGYGGNEQTGRYTTICNDCGQDQNRPVRRRKVRR